jgi:hypothetical protein
MSSLLAFCGDVGEDPPEPPQSNEGPITIRAAAPPTRINVALDGYFLIADPACPHLAPWAP